ncbi:DUF3046 domain-containing protein [Paraoerskovia marina]|uniref:DUF3046 domain-containing protein n=1 Tax=Paraoerskovia marina TaxID=545619 RepID=A0A1H1TVR1_9CELL|nr:DUF3046 domain-containing protein [Paraoerskovia marina]SDS64290.1 Protein of unknown function [Paraoerskovia marina]
MRYREFWQLVDEVFGADYGRVLASDHSLNDLGSRTAVAALDDGEEPRVVWHALCNALQVPESDRWGVDEFRQAPPQPGSAAS